MDLELKGKRALLVGGSRGIGKQVARQLAREGVMVALAARDKGRLDTTAGEISKESGLPVFVTTVDTTNMEAVRRMGDEVATALGGIDILVNSAATPRNQGPQPRFDGVTDELFNEQMNTKILGYLRCAQVAAPYMIKSGWGRIINVSGIGAREVSWVVGTVRNVGVHAMSKNLADELGPHGINVTVVHPGPTRTEATPEGAEVPPGKNIVGRMITGEEVANVVTFLCSPKSVAIAGEAIPVCGGQPRVVYY